MNTIILFMVLMTTNVPTYVKVDEFETKEQCQEEAKLLTSIFKIDDVKYVCSKKLLTMVEEYNEESISN